MTLEVQKGPLVYIERIDITGNEKTADKVIRRELLLSEGALYSETGKEQSQFRVLRLGYFSNVDISTSRGSSDDKIVVNVEVTEQLTGTFQIGAGFSSVENFIAQAQISQNNLFGHFFIILGNIDKFHIVGLIVILKSFRSTCCVRV